MQGLHYCSSDITQIRRKDSSMHVQCIEIGRGVLFSTGQMKRLPQKNVIGVCVCAPKPGSVQCII